MDEVEVKVSMSMVTVGGYARALIKHVHENNLSVTNEALAARVVAEFAKQGVEVKTSAACIAWYKNKMKDQLPGMRKAKSIEINLENIEI